MKFKLTQQQNPDYSTLEQIMFNRGFAVEDIEDYLEADYDCLLDPIRLDNIDKGIALLMKMIDEKKRIFLQVDSDADGYTSASLFLNVLDDLYGLENIDITYRVHNGKEHGVILDTVIQDGKGLYDLVVLIDAGSNQFEEHAALNEVGTSVLVIDHHDCEEYSEHAVIINNQMSSNYYNKAMCGVGIAYKFCQRMEQYFEDANFSNQYLDLVAVGSIADMMDMRQKETHYLTKSGLDNLKNPLLSGLVEKQSFSLRGTLTRIGVAFYIAPLINATIRVGTQEEKEIMFKAMLGGEAFELIPSTKRGCKGQMETVLDQAIRNCTNVHARQRRMRDAGAAAVEAYIKEHNVGEDKVMVVMAQPELDKNLVGLVANQLMAEYKRPVLLLREGVHENEKVLQGSGRGYDRSELKDFKGFLIESGFFNFAEGHASAFGAALPLEKKDAFIEYANHALEDFSFDSSYEVDYIFEGLEVDKDIVFDIGQMKPLWGKGIDEPYIAIQGLTVTPKRVQMLSPSKPTLKITLPNGLEIMKFFSSQEEYQSLTCNPDGAVVLNIIAKCSLNEWKGVVKPQLIISEYEIIGEHSFIF